MSTKTLIKTIDVGAGGIAAIDFTAILATYNDLLLECSLRSTSNDGNPWTGIIVALNGSTASFTGKRLYGTGAGSGSSDSASPFGGFADGNTATANAFSSGQIYIPNYASANYKTLSVDTVTETNGATAVMGLISALWSNTAVINQITLTLAAGNFVQYSTASLYGIKNS